MIEQQVQMVAHKPSRAQVLRDKVQIRLAVNEAGPAIAQILKENGVELPGIKWDDVFPHWLIATNGDEVIGCCQVLIAKPFGFVDFLFVRPKLTFKLRAIAIRKLMLQGIRTLEVAGASYAGAFVSEKNGKLKSVLEHMECKPAGKCDLMVKRLINAW